MSARILMCEDEWQEQFNYLMSLCSRESKLITIFTSMDRKAKNHFARRYDDCAACVDLDSRPVKNLVSYHFFDSRHQQKRNAPEVKTHCLTCHVIFENGESLSDIEAIAGLGDIAPKHLKRKIEKVRNGSLHDGRHRIGGYRNIKSKGGVTIRTQ